MPNLPTPVEAPSKLEVLLTAFVFPGAGQLMQGRKLVGIIHVALAGALVAVLFYVALIPFYRNLAILLEMNGHTSREPLISPSIPAILATIGVLLVLHLASILDAASAYRNRCLLWKRAQREKPE